MVTSKGLLCTVVYCSKLQVVKSVESILAEDLKYVIKAVFTHFGLPPKIISYVGKNFVREQFKEFCRCLNIDQDVVSLYDHQSNGQVKACIKFVKCTIKKYRTKFILLYFRLDQDSLVLGFTVQLKCCSTSPLEPINIDYNGEYLQSLKIKAGSIH